jgi:Lar family restriction alleviation protein
MNKELKPCPFCGSTSLKVESKHNGRNCHTGTHSATVRCSKCHARGSTASSKAGYKIYSVSEEAINRAIELWNRRAGDNGE